MIFSLPQLAFLESSKSHDPINPSERYCVTNMCITSRSPSGGMIVSGKCFLTPPGIECIKYSIDVRDDFWNEFNTVNAMVEVICGRKYEANSLLKLGCKYTNRNITAMYRGDLTLDEQNIIYSIYKSARILVVRTRYTGRKTGDIHKEIAETNKRLQPP